ncbi:MAG: UbiD family decarboxylase [Caldilineales bacterium]|nr:UbiD family decarboxylase [Caldilineales bacterium]MDW8318033.1 UbiD family decarboxylase [Anaerolineae bacterium]
MHDLQSFLVQYMSDYPEDVVRVTEALPRDYQVTALAMATEQMAEPPVIVCDAVEAAGMPVVTNLFASRVRIARILGTTVEALHDHWAARSKHLIPPVEVSEGVCQEVCRLGDDADATQLPFMVHFEQDAGRYLTSGVVAARDPDTGAVNLSFARMQLKGPRRFGISVHSRGHLWDYQRRAEARGRPLDVAVVVGMHPIYMIAAASRMPMGVDEQEVAGALLGHPLEVVRGVTVDVPVPAAAEIVLEGRIEPNVREPEGPFGEYTGYATARSTNNVFTLTAITHRRQPWFLDVCPGHSRDHLLLGRIHKEAEVLRKLREVLPNVKAIHYPVSGTHYHCYISIAKQRPGDARHCALLALGLDAYIKLVVVVDDDVDVHNEAEVMWALATRVQPAEDVFIVHGVTCNVLDPSSYDGVSSKMGIDATRPAGWDAQRTSLPREVVLRAHDLLRSHRNRLQ